MKPKHNNEQQLARARVFFSRGNLVACRLTLDTLLRQLSPKDDKLQVQVLWRLAMLSLQELFELMLLFPAVLQVSRQARSSQSGSPVSIYIIRRSKPEYCKGIEASYLSTP